jgi:hypothetical protein
MMCSEGGDVNNSGSEYGFTRRNESRGDVGGEAAGPGEVGGNRSAHSDSNVR